MEGSLKQLRFRMILSIAAIRILVVLVLDGNSNYVIAHVFYIRTIQVLIINIYI